MNPLVSVVVTTYNQAAYIEHTLKSVFAQTYAPYEVIVVDDGSTDDTPARIASLNENVIYIRQKNQGVAGSRNTGILRARGEYIAFLDGDDLWEPEKLAVQVEVARRHPDSGLTAVDGSMFDGDETIATTLFYQPWCKELGAHSITTGNYYHQLLHGQFIYTTSQVMVPARVLKIVGLSNDNFKRASDYDLYIRIAAKFDFTIVKMPLTRWRYLSTSASGTMNSRFFNYLLEDIAILKNHLRECHRNDLALIRGIINSKLADGAEKLYNHGLQTDRYFATRHLLRLFAVNFASPVAVAFLAGLWCPVAIKDKLKPAVRRVLLRTATNDTR